MKKRKKEEIHRKRIRRNILIELAIFLTLMVIAVYVQSFFFFSVAKVTSYEMSPTLRFGEYVILEKVKRFQRQDIVLIHRKGSKLVEIKRIIGLPNEKIAYVNGQLYVNDIARHEPFIAIEQQENVGNVFSHTKDFTLHELTGKQHLPKDTYFVLGDNRLYSSYSREYSVIKKEEIIGVVYSLA